MAEQYTFTVNGKRVSTSKQTSMLRFLRDELHLHSVKDGCSEGACGACMILVDGKPTRACVLKTQRAAGKEIVTVEGLTDLEKEAFVYAFGVSGSVQCGFCTPGMVISAAGLLRQNPDPTDEEIKTAIRGNLCRCTGYRKIIEGIRLAGEVLRGVKQIDYEPEQEDYGRVGTRTFRVECARRCLEPASTRMISRLRTSGRILTAPTVSRRISRTAGEAVSSASRRSRRGAGCGPLWRAGTAVSMTERQKTGAMSMALMRPPWPMRRASGRHTRERLSERLTCRKPGRFRA